MVEEGEKSGVEVIGPKSLISLANAVLGSALAFGWSMGVLNVPEPYIRCWIVSLKNETINCTDAIDLNNEGALDDSTLAWALSTAILPLGAIIGGMGGGTLANSFGRKTCMLWNAVLGVGIGLLLGACRIIGNIWVFIAARFLNGLNVGLNSAIAPVYINEISPNTQTGSFGACFQLGVTTGIVIANILGLTYLMGTEPLWPWLLALGAVPCVIQIVLCFMSPESPTYLLSNGNVIAAKAANMALKGPDAILDETNTIESQSLWSNIKEVFTIPPVRKAALVCVFLMIFQQLCGINAIFFYSGSIFKNAGVPQDLAGVATVGLSTVNVLFVVVAILYSDRLGRRTLLLTGFSIMTVMAVLTTILLTYSDNEIIGYLTIVPICIFVAAFEIGPGPIPWACASESIPSQYKAGTAGLATATNWFCAFIIGLIFPPMQEAIDQYSFIPFAAVSLIALVYIYFKVVETSGKSVEQVQAEYEKQKGC